MKVLYEITIGTVGVWLSVRRSVLRYIRVQPPDGPQNRAIGKKIIHNHTGKEFVDSSEPGAYMRSAYLTK